MSCLDDQPHYLVGALDDGRGRPHAHPTDEGIQLHEIRDVGPVVLYASAYNREASSTKSL